MRDVLLPLADVVVNGEPLWLESGRRDVTIHGGGDAAPNASPVEYDLPPRARLFQYVPSMPYCYDHPLRVPYRDCTPQGLLRPRHYLDYFKAARVHALRALGVRYRSLEDDGILMPVVDAEISSRHLVRYDDRLTVRACFPETVSARISTRYTVSPSSAAASETVLATGRVTVCFVFSETGRPVRPPRRIRRALQTAAAEAEATRSSPSA